MANRMILVNSLIAGTNQSSSKLMDLNRRTMLSMRLSITRTRWK